MMDPLLRESLELLLLLLLEDLLKFNIQRMHLALLLRHSVEVVDSLVWSSHWFPCFGQWFIESRLCNPQQISIRVEIKAQELGILEYLVARSSVNFANGQEESTRSPLAPWAPLLSP